MSRWYIVTLVEETYPPLPESDEDYNPDPEYDRWTVECEGLHELVRVIEDHVGACDPDVMPHGGHASWFQSVDEDWDYRTGEHTVRSAHLPDDLDPRARRAVTRAVLS